MGEPLLPPLPEDAFARVLCVVAHPDDPEYGTSSAVASRTARGIEVAYLLLTRGGAGMDAVPPERTAPLRVQGQLAASPVVGVTEVTSWTTRTACWSTVCRCAATSPGSSVGGALHAPPPIAREAMGG